MNVTKLGKINNQIQMQGIRLFTVYCLYIFFYKFEVIQIKLGETHVVVIQSLSHVQLCDSMDCTQHTRPLSPGVCSDSCPVDLVMLTNHLILCCPLLLLPSLFPSIRVLFNQFTLHIRWPQSWSFSFSITPSNDYSGLSSFRIDWFDLLAVQGTLKSLLQDHNSKASILWHSAF